jgi:hypothetical protein
MPAGRGATKIQREVTMLIDAGERVPELHDGDPPYDRAMLALQYITAIVAVVAALLMGPIR